MLANCAFSCAKLDYARQRYERRCPKPKNYTQAVAPGQMPSTFARIMQDFPELQPEEISSDPPVILFHNFLSPDETDAFIKHGRGKCTPAPPPFTRLRRRPSHARARLASQTRSRSVWA
jgi:hypothetical protein